MPIREICYRITYSGGFKCYPVALYLCKIRELRLPDSLFYLDLDLSRIHPYPVLPPFGGSLPLSP